MEIIKIGNDSFKISLNAKEAQKYDFVSLVSCSDCDMTSSLKELLDIVKEKNGIDFGEEKMCVEIYLSSDGGCDIFVSKTNMSDNKLAKLSTRSNTKAVYAFDSLDDLIHVCSRLKTISFDKSSNVYYSRQCEKYYLALNGIFYKDLKYAFMSEYGTKLKNTMAAYIMEQLECICENNGVEIFSKLL